MKISHFVHFKLAMANSYEIPSWAGKPSNGLHLDIVRDGNFVTKIMIDDKKVLFFSAKNYQLICILILVLLFW